MILTLMTTSTKTKLPVANHHRFYIHFVANLYNTAS